MGHKVSTRPFALSRGVWVTHEKLSPQHTPSGWDVRCSACQQARQYVTTLVGATVEGESTGNQGISKCARRYRLA